MREQIRMKDPEAMKDSPVQDLLLAVSKERLPLPKEAFNHLSACRSFMNLHQAAHSIVYNAVSNFVQVYQGTMHTQWPLMLQNTSLGANVVSDMMKAIPTFSPPDLFSKNSPTLTLVLNEKLSRPNSVTEFLSRYWNRRNTARVKGVLKLLFICHVQIKWKLGHLK